jgi:peptidoglycan/xylan/chitin deacetylase (PgdA/CDA1 family)
VDKTLSLTFDDGPDPRWTRRILEVLRGADARATFFMVGERVREAPEIALAVLAAGHEVQLHCERHLRHSELSEAEIDRDTRAGLASLAAIGVRPTHWRTPWGVRTSGSERVARTHRLKLVGWTIDTHDWRGDSPAAMLDAARPLLADRAIVLMHDALGPGALRASCENTLALIEPLLVFARRKGLAVTPLGATQSSVEHEALADAALAGGMAG